jgi:cysteinyl-tRNA synthetase
MLAIFNTLTGKKDPIRRPAGRDLRFFVCGPTVYDDPHIGNARTFVTFDAFAKFLRLSGIKVFYLQNITDIDDKIITRAAERQMKWKDLARMYEKIYKDWMKSLNVTSVNKYARATDFIPEIVSQVKTLIKRKHAYLIEGDGYYYDLSTFPDYGKLARRTIEQAEDAVTRIDSSDKKRHRGDFCLWKFSKPGEPSWKTELGEGRPGWHIEDTAITYHYFGPQYDIHGGAVDLKFPHHEAEIAQAEGAWGKKPFMKLWMHSGFLTVNGQKMSKSSGNFVTIGQMLSSYPADAFRMLVMTHHYRSPLDYSKKLMDQSEENAKSISKFLSKLQRLASSKTLRKQARPFPFAILPRLEKFKKKFIQSLEDDFGTPQAMAAVFEFMTEVQPAMWDLKPRESKTVFETLMRFLKGLGFAMESPDIPAKIQEIVENREHFRKNKDFVESDKLRKQLGTLGYGIEDTPLGPFVWPEVNQ